MATVNEQAIICGDEIVCGLKKNGEYCSYRFVEISLAVAGQLD